MARWQQLLVMPELDGFVWQIERGEVGGNRHIQAYVVFKRNIRFNAVRALIPGAHIERCYGSHEQCVAYCTKEETRLEGPWASSEEFCSSRYSLRLVPYVVIADVWFPSMYDIPLDFHNPEPPRYTPYVDVVYPVHITCTPQCRTTLYSDGTCLVEWLEGAQQGVSELFGTHI